MLEVKGLKKAYKKGRYVLDIPYFKAEQGIVTGIFGINGSGKSTLLKCIVGLLNYEGQIALDGNELRADVAQMRRVGLLIEEPAFFREMSGRENIIRLCDDCSAPERYADALDMQGFLDTKFGRYSMGMKQKLGILLALVKGKRLIVLDEPFSNLDVIGIEQALAAIRIAAEAGSAVVLTSHQLDVSRHICDLSYLLIDKNLILRGEKNARGNRFRLTFYRQEDAIAAQERLAAVCECTLRGAELYCAFPQERYETVTAAMRRESFKSFEDLSDSLYEDLLEAGKHAQ